MNINYTFAPVPHYYSRSTKCEKLLRGAALAGTLAAGVAGTEKLYNTSALAGAVFGSSIALGDFIYHITGSLRARKIGFLTLNMLGGGLLGLISLKTIKDKAAGFEGKLPVAMAATLVVLFAAKRLTYRLQNARTCNVFSNEDDGLPNEFVITGPRQYDDMGRDDEGMYQRDGQSFTHLTDVM